MDGIPTSCRIGRNSLQNAISNAVALGGESVRVATLAQDYAFGRNGVAAFRTALEGTGAEALHERYVPTDTTDLTAAAERIFVATEGAEGEKKLLIIWAGGGNPTGRINLSTRCAKASRSPRGATSWRR